MSGGGQFRLTDAEMRFEGGVDIEGAKLASLDPDEALGAIGGGAEKGGAPAGTRGGGIEKEGGGTFIEGKPLNTALFAKTPFVSVIEASRTCKLL